MEKWHPTARVDRFDDAGGFLAGPYRGILHTTEGKSYAGARSSYAANKVAPHFTIGAEGLWQHVALDRAARALQNAPGGVQTNLLSSIQIEIIKFARDGWPDQLTEAVRSLMIWIETQTGIRPVHPTFYGDDAGFTIATTSSRIRMNAATWNTFDGWCGHQHVPENGHWDPGKVPDRLFDRAQKQALTVTSTAYPQGDEMLTRFDINRKLDAQGNGWFDLDIDPMKIVSIIPNGPYPPADGYWNTPVVARQNRDGKTIVTLTEGPANQDVLVSVWVTG